MPDIATNIDFIKSQIPSTTKLVAVSKTQQVEQILVAYNAGQRLFGENKVQELLNKKDLLPEDIEWHLIGHLQSNKVKLIVPFISMIQSVDSFRLLKIINSEASKITRVVDCLLQVHIAMEETKFGFSFEEIEKMLETQEYLEMNNVRICGVMGMATFTSDKDQITREFQYLHNCFNSLKKKYFNDISYFKEVSMGMSGDYRIAIQQGGSIIRIGSLIFGERNKVK